MEEAVGISVFLTKTQGIGGRLKSEPEDFVVEEISGDMEPEDEGKYTIAKVRSRNWETNRLVRKLARILRISRRRIRFAGTKDKRAITTQLFQFEHPMENVRTIDLKDVEILDLYLTNKKLEIGDLFGNRFNIVARDLEMPIEDAYSSSFETAADILETGGFPNFFGIQRFGAVRPVTHLVGRHIVKGDLEQAVMTYVANPIEGESEEAFEARRALQDDHDFGKALQNFPEKLSFEKAVLNHLVKDEDDYVGALNQLPGNLLLMFVHAHQSFLFNKVLSKRMEKELPLNEPTLGDYILPLDRFGLPDHNKWIAVKERNLEKATEQVRRRKAFVSSILFGTESEFSAGEMGEIEKGVIEDEGLQREDFFVQQMRRLSSKGTRREILAPLDDIEIEKREDSLVFSFQLNKGCYATCLLREFMKTNALNY
ncbi:MAG: tRNA pseudouridine(13) synthase TruD [Thermoplasmata archaeon]|nr:tRNA pseudouridine(13) synthase TruD [Thermoplasmata archaeon]